MEKIAIVGMDACFGHCEDLDSLDRSFYDGEPLSKELTHLPESDLQRLMVKIATGALRDSGVEPGSKVAVVLGGTEDSLPVQIAALWNFSGSILALEGDSTILRQGLETARMLLSDRQADAVVLGAVSSPRSALTDSPADLAMVTWRYDQQSKQSKGAVLGTGAGAVVLKRLDSARRDENRIYATVDAIAQVSSQSAAIRLACEQAHCAAGIAPAKVGYLEICGSGTPLTDELEVVGLTSAYRIDRADERLSCAIGSATANVGYAGAAAGIASTIKTALCLYHRYIPAVPNWSAPKQLEQWKDSPFYVAQSSHSWLLEASKTARSAAISAVSADGGAIHLVLSEEITQISRPSRYLASSPLRLLAIAGADIDDLRARLMALQAALAGDTPLAEIARQTFAAYQQRHPYAISLVGETRQALEQEVQRALAGLAAAFTGEDWQTPAGSCFTAAPLGRSGKVAFVYPGAFNAYLGVSQDQLRLFPELYNHAVLKSTGDRYAQLSRSLYPRSLKALSRRQLEKLENKFLADPKLMFDAEMACASLTTAVLQRFRLSADIAFGYSLGETSMMVAQGVFPASEFSSRRLSFDRSPLFNGRLSGAQNAVRECWNLPALDSKTAEDGKIEGRSLWCIYVVLAPIEAVEQAIESVQRAYITQINTSQEVVIAGAPAACEQVLKTLDCPSFKVPFNHVIHCPPAALEKAELEQLHAFSVQDTSSTSFYTAAASGPVELTQAAISQSIAQGLGQTLDFPKLVRRTYEDGARIFVEVGAGGSCSRLIGQILEQQPHLTVALNIRGMRDRTALIKAIARLVSHRVDLDLSTLYPNKSDRSSPTSALLAAEQANGLVSKTHSRFLSGRRAALQHLQAMIELQMRLSRTVVSSTEDVTEDVDGHLNLEPTAFVEKSALIGGVRS